MDLIPLCISGCEGLVELKECSSCPRRFAHPGAGLKMTLSEKRTGLSPKSPSIRGAVGSHLFTLGQLRSNS